MKTLVTMIAIMGAAMLLGAPAQADWNPGDPAKYVQLPDLGLSGATSGMDVNATWQNSSTVVPPNPVYPYVKVLADDFPCTTTGPITDIHVWGSWLNDKPNPNTTFHLSIHADVPANAANPYSYPGQVLWQQDFTPTSYTARLYPYPSGPELFYDPNQDRIIGQDTQVWQYNFTNIPQPFVQQGTAANPLVYWLDVQAVVPGTETFGWKTSDPTLSPHFGDDAVFADTNLPLSMGGTLIGPAPPPVFWHDMHYPVGNPYAGQSIDQAFAITTTVPEPGTLVLLGCGLVVLLGYAWRKMNTRTKRILACAGLLLAIAAFTPSARANLLVDPGFESNPLTTAANVLGNFPLYQGQWGAENGAITGAVGPISPYQGTLMLSMSDDGQTTTQTFQATDVTSYAALINSGSATVNMSAMFNADPNVPAAIGGVYVSFFTGNTYGTLTGYIGNTLTLDNLTNTWEPISVSGPIPVGTTWLVSQVAYSDASLMGSDGAIHPSYVDAAGLTVTPEPSTLALLGCGFVGLVCYVWRKRTWR